MPTKIIRDPVHDVIAFDIERPLDGLLFALINSAEFQRLRRIQQLGMAHLAYPGATHTRYNHSLGVMQTARRMAGHLREVAALTPEQETLLVAGALLHDLGHGPFSHVFERVSGISHERLTGRLIVDPQSEVHRILFLHDRYLPEGLARFLRGEGEHPRYLHDAIASQLDADRFDYLLRDNHMTGAGYGDFDLEWLLHSLAVDEGSGRLAVTWKGVSAVEDYLHARYNMYRNVYFHKVVRSAEGMVKLALQRARRLAVQDRLPGPGREDAVYKALLGQRLGMEQFVQLDDVSVNHCFKLWMGCDDPVLARLCHGLLFRRLYKTVDLSHIGDAAEMAGLYARAQEAVTRAGGEADYDLFHDEPVDTPYESFDPRGAAEPIFIRQAEGGLVTLDEISPIPRALNARLMFRRVHVRGEFKEVVAGAVGVKS